MVGGANSGEFKLIVQISRDGKDLRAEAKVTFVDAPKAVVVLDNWDDSVSASVDLAGSIFPKVDARLIDVSSLGSDMDVFTDNRDYPPNATSMNQTPCLSNDDNKGILLTSKSDKFFNTSGDTSLTPGTGSETDQCSINPATNYWEQTASFTIGGGQASFVKTNQSDFSQQDPPPNPAKLASATRNLGFDRFVAAFDQHVTDTNCSNPNVDIYLIPNGLYNPVSAGHISASGDEYPRETVLIFDGGANTVNEVIRGKVHLIFKGGGNTTFNGNVATVGNVIVHGVGTTLTFAPFPTSPRKIAGDLYVFPTDYSDPPQFVMEDAIFYKSLDMVDYIGIDRLAQVASKVECTDKTRNNNLYNPFIFQVTSLAARVGS